AVIIGYVLSLIGMLLLAYAAYEIPRQLVQSARAVAAAERVKAAIDDIGSSVSEAESIARTYIITGDAPALERYLLLLPEINQDIAAFREMTARNHVHQESVRTLQLQITERFNLLTSTVRSIESPGFSAEAQPSAIAPSSSVSAIRSTLSAMYAEEDIALAARRAVEERITRRLNILIAAIVMIGVLILTWVSWQTHHALRLRRDSEEHVRHLAYHDTLTTLPNRRLLIDRLTQLIASVKRNNGRFAVFFLDLDGFKNVNDTLGHDGGDELLRQVAARLQELVRAEDTVARLGGDEFVLALRVEQDGDAVVVAHKVLETMTQPYTVKDREVTISTSVGVAIHPDAGDAPEVLLKAADDALYLAKRGGKNRFKLASESGPAPENAG
ncbi:MAG TPA: diguanylate cyclase, partial [Burkholderiales bacterium]|nr:diguanylate cyclase [Burkholderiales bacterium]